MSTKAKRSGNGKVLAWHFVAVDTAGNPVQRDGKPALARGVERHDGALELYASGLHAAVKPLDALAYAPGAIVRRVEYGGKVLRCDDRLVCTRRRILWQANATATLRLFAVWCARSALEAERKAGREPDPRSLAACDVAERHAHGKATDAELADARYAALATAKTVLNARTAAWAAEATAWAVEAAWCAAVAASVEARTVVSVEAQNRTLTRMLLELAPN